MLLTLTVERHKLKTKRRRAKDVDLNLASASRRGPVIGRGREASNEAAIYVLSPQSLTMQCDTYIMKYENSTCTCRFRIRYLSLEVIASQNKEKTQFKNLESVLTRECQCHSLFVLSPISLKSPAHSSLFSD